MDKKPNNINRPYLISFVLTSIHRKSWIGCEHKKLDFTLRLEISLDVCTQCGPMGEQGLEKSGFVASSWAIAAAALVENAHLTLYTLAANIRVLMVCIGQVDKPRNFTVIVTPS